MRLAVHPTAVSSAVAIALAIAAPAASAGLELNPGPNLSSQATSATASVRSHPDEQPELTRGVRVPPSPRGLGPPDLAALDRVQAREAKVLAANLAHPTRSANAPRPATIAAPSLPAASDSFNWGDGAIGAGAAGLIVLLLTAGHRAMRQRRRPATPN
jgi:hypothetical protein